MQRITTAVDMIANAADPDMPSWPNPSLKWNGKDGEWSELNSAKLIQSCIAARAARPIVRLQSNKLKTEPFRLEKFTSLAHVKYEWVIKELIINSIMTFCTLFGFYSLDPHSFKVSHLQMRGARRGK